MTGCSMWQVQPICADIAVILAAVILYYQLEYCTLLTGVHPDFFNLKSVAIIKNISVKVIFFYYLPSVVFSTQ